MTTSREHFVGSAFDVPATVTFTYNEITKCGNKSNNAVTNQIKKPPKTNVILANYWSRHSDNSPNWK